MNWKEIWVGAAITLGITIIGGVVVWWGTERFFGQKGEVVSFNSDFSTSFQSNDSNVGTATVNINNVGDQAAEAIVADVEFTPQVKVDDSGSEASSGKLLKFETSRPAQNKVLVSIPSLNPNESLKLSFLLSGTGNFEPTVNVRSKRTVGRREVVEDQKSLFTWFPFAVGGILTLVSMYLARKFTRGLNSWPTAADHNNSAFVLIQKKEIDLAEELLTHSIKREGFGFYSLNNYALVVGLKGDKDRANRLFGAAEWWCNGKYQESLLNVNKSILNFHLKNNDIATEFLSKALGQSEATTKSICSVNEYIKEAASADLRIQQMVTEAKGKPGYKIAMGF